MKNDELRRRAEARLSEQKRTASLAPVTKVEALRLVHELQVHQIELEMQNEELILARAGLETALGQYTELYDYAPVGYFTLARDGAIRQVNLAGANLLGVARGALIQRRLGQFVVPDSLPLFNACLEKAANSAGRASCEVALLKSEPDSAWACIEAVCHENGPDEGYRCAMVDITERKQAEAMQARSAAIVQDSDDAIFSKDLQGVLLSWNEGAEKLYGYGADEAIGRSVSILIPPDQPNELPAILERIGRGGRLQHFETTRVRKDGSLVPVSLTISPILDASGQIVGVSSIARDISARRQAQAALQEANTRLRALSMRLAEVQEAERRALARELHDQVGQNLTALNINLNILRAQLPPEGASQLEQRIVDSLALVRETTARTREVMVELHPPLLDDYGLVAALRAHVDRLAQRVNLEIVVTGIEPAPRLAAPVEMALFRIAQEALNNVAKHAGATQASLALEESPAGIRLTVADNGAGFDPAARPRPDAPPVWGFVTMRERAAAFGGHLRLETRPGQGTRIVIEVAR